MRFETEIISFNIQAEMADLSGIRECSHTLFWVIFIIFIGVSDGSLIFHGIFFKYVKIGPLSRTSVKSNPYLKIFDPSLNRTLEQ